MVATMPPGNTWTYTLSLNTGQSIEETPAWNSGKRRKVEERKEGLSLEIRDLCV